MAMSSTKHDDQHTYHRLASAIHTHPADENDISVVTRLQRFRGGAKKDNKKHAKDDRSTGTKGKGKKTTKDDEEVESAEEMEEVDLSEGYEEAEGEEGSSVMDRVKGLHVFDKVTDIWHKTPPLTQVYLLSSIVFTTLSFLVNKNQWPEFLTFEWKPILTQFQFWRLFTGFLFFGPLDIFYPLTLQFVWQHMSQLEKLNYKHPEEFFVMIIFGAVTLIGLYTLFGISTHFLGHNLATYLVYIWSRVFEGSDVNFMDLLVLKAEMIPWFFCAQTFLLEHEIPVADLIGIAVGHFYYYLKQKKKLFVPEPIKNWFEKPEVISLYKRFKDEFE